MVECTGLENQRTARYRGFESLRLRKKKRTKSPLLKRWVFLYAKLKLEKESFNSLNGSAVNSKTYLYDMRNLILFCMSGLLCHGVLAQTSLSTNILKYKLADGSSYIDVCIEIASASMEIELIDSLWKTHIEIAISVENLNELVSFRKVHLEGPLTSDSLIAHTGSHFHLERIKLDHGNYSITTQIDGVSIVDEMSISLGDRPEISDIMLIEAYSKVTPGEVSDISRSGMNLVPLVDTRISPMADQARFYVELYNIDKVVGEDSLFLMSFGFTGGDGRMSINHTRYLRLKAAAVIPVFETLPVDLAVPPLEGGFLTIELRTKNGDEITRLNYPVSRWRPDTSLPLSDVPLLNFASNWTDIRKLYRHLEDHLPLGTSSQQNTILRVLKETNDIDMMKGFLEQFWVNKNPNNPQKAWENYAHEVMVVDSIFGGCRSGHGADTDQGYVYLKYGRPNTIVSRLYGTDYYPYEIWHYHHTVGLSNRRFLFFAPHVVSECLEILHSDMPGEIRNEDWIEVLKSRENRLKVTESQLNRLNPRDTHSREEPEELFYSPR